VFCQCGVKLPILLAVLWITTVLHPVWMIMMISVRGCSAIFPALHTATSWCPNLSDVIATWNMLLWLCCRALAGEDGIDSLTSRAGSYAKRVAWVNANREAIVAAVKERMLQLATSAA
jgi:hypothetical protein